MVRHLLVLLLCCAGAARALSEPQVVSVRSGSTQTVTIHLAFRDWLLSRETPNEVRLQTPWGTLQAIPQGRPHDQRSTYFGLLHPAALRLHVPGQVAAARYPARLEATLYVCQKQQQLCSRRQLNLPVVLRVTSQAAAVASVLTITDEHLSRTSTWRPGAGVRDR